MHHNFELELNNLEIVQKSLIRGLKANIKSIYILDKVIYIQTTISCLNSIIYYLGQHSLYKYNQLQDICCCDIPKAQLRFSLNYILRSLLNHTTVVVSIQTNEVISVPTITNLYLSANWLEREIWDMFGIFFSENTDLRRILTDYGFKGYPLRKDFPLTGFVELYYDDKMKTLVYKPVLLAQESRIWNSNFGYFEKN